MTESGLFSLTRDGDVGHLVIEGAPRNELSFKVFDQFVELVDHVLPQQDLAGLVISGRGRHFSSGSNVAELLERAKVVGNESSPSWCEIHSEHFQALRGLPYPIVAAVSGCCLGSGLELALACTARVASENAVFAMPESQHGLIPGCGGTVNLTELIGYRKAMKLILSGELLSAQQACELGLVDIVVGRKELIPTAERLISCID
jgi:enoyl-CoA hydratase